MPVITNIVLNILTSIIVGIVTGLITGVIVAAYYDLSNLKHALLYEIRRINYIQHGDNEVEILNPRAETEIIKENIILLTSRALGDFNEKGRRLQCLQRDILHVINNGKASDMKGLNDNWQKMVRGLRLSRTDVIRKLRDITHIG
ncbi:hypothetical protein L2W58_03485 [Dethiosulfovibrio sp. F2B]|uniref:hypothetical protein n=1 Tax=Dethiosulfovibrio faecalis TaxID=2720018 RepID=UPI001F2031A6|nr:hypothetical protein [Dethiosulfovibrio faecalis]MCF4150853.1 hypothetical protein [Dethiosulfovibrio faecalis]